VTPDSSALVAAFAPWHEAHGAAAARLTDVKDLVAHAELETYSVLTRLPEPQRAPADVAAQYLSESFAGARLVLPAARRRRLVSDLQSLGIRAGAAYDALIALTAAAHGHALLTCDRRAQSLYARLSVDHELLTA